VRNGDTARLEVSNDGSTWSSVWSASGAILDISWTAVQYDLSAVATGHPAVRLRWAMGANADTQVSFGWNIDDVQVYADGAVTDAEAPIPLLSVSDITVGGSPTHQFAVTYTDDTAVAVSSIGAGDVMVVDPGGSTNPVSFVGIDEPTDGTPRTASYALDAPGGLWDASDNGAYEVLMVYGEVRDSTGNEIAGGSLGSFQVNILPRWLLTVSNRPPEGGSVSPPGGEFVQGAPVELTAAPAVYYRFRDWTEDATGTNNPLVLAMASNLYVVANFEELLTTNHPTPLWWLASFGVTGDFETAVLQTGANGLALWQSYIAGLVPTNETSVLDVLGTVLDDGRTFLAWPTVSGRVYTVSVSTNLAGAFGPLSGAIRLPWTDNTRTAAAPAFFRIEVERE
jgi:hypothetical protein